MRRCLLALSFCLLLTGVWVLARPSCPGTPAPYGEAEHAIGALCYDQSEVYEMTVCSNPCSFCGCRIVPQFIPGSFSTLSAPCNISIRPPCTAIWILNTKINCDGGT
jgi:hypothetical protein